MNVRTRLNGGLLAPLLVLFAGCTVRAQIVGPQLQVSPLKGQGTPGPTVSDGVYLSVFLDRLLHIDEQKYTFNAVLYTYVTWVDTAGIEQWFSNNIATNCADPSRNDYNQTWCADFKNVCERFQNATPGSAAQQAALADGTYFLGANITIPCQTYNSDGTPARTSCTRYCSTDYTSSDCCDGIYIPHIELSNIYELSQDSITTSRLEPQYNYHDDSYGSFMWSSQIHAELFIRMNFRAFPFDSQKLLIQANLMNNGADVNDATNATTALVTSSSGVLSLRPSLGGDDSSGWQVDRVYMEYFPIADPLQLIKSQGTVQPPNPKDPVPLFSEGTVNGKFQITGLQPIFTQRLFSGTPVLVVIEASRYSRYYVVNNIVPIVLSTALSFFVYLIPAENLDLRLGLLVTLFLALTALQFVISTNLPSSSYVLRSQKLVLTGYTFFIAMAIESWIVYFLGSTHKRHSRMRAWRQACKLYLKGELPESTLDEVASGGALPPEYVDPGDADCQPSGKSGVPGPPPSGSGRRSSLSYHSAHSSPSSHVQLSSLAPNGDSGGGGSGGERKKAAAAMAASASPAPSGELLLPPPDPQLCGDGEQLDTPAFSRLMGKPALAGPGGGRAQLNGRHAGQPPSFPAATDSTRAHRAAAAQSAADRAAAGGWRQRWHLPVSPAKHDPAYAEWLSGQVDRWSFIFLVTAYVIVLAVILAA